MITRHFPQPDLRNISGKFSLMDSSEGHKTNVLRKTWIISLTDVVNIYEQSVDETPNLSA